MLEDNPISAVRFCVFSIRRFLTALHIQKPYCPSASRGRAIPWTQGPTCQGVAQRPCITAPVTYKGTVIRTYKVSAHPLTWEWEQIHFPKRCRHFWTQGETQGPEICNAVTYHRQKAFVCWFGIHHCVWRYTMGKLLDISGICSGFKPFEFFLFLCFSRSVQKSCFIDSFFPENMFWRTKHATAYRSSRAYTRSTRDRTFLR